VLLPPPELFARLARERIAGEYRREPVGNPRHEGVVTAAPLRWQNRAGVSWSLNWRPGRLDTGPDNPYYSNSTGRSFQIELRRGPDGEWLPGIRRRGPVCAFRSEPLPSCKGPP